MAGHRAPLSSQPTTKKLPGSICLLLLSGVPPAMNLPHPFLTFANKCCNNARATVVARRLTDWQTNWAEEEEGDLIGYYNTYNRYKERRRAHEKVGGNYTYNTKRGKQNNKIITALFAWPAIITVSPPPPFVTVSPATLLGASAPTSTPREQHSLQ